MKRVVLTLGWIFAVTMVCSAQSTFYFPQIADGGGWKTTIFITNPAAAGSPAVSGSVIFTDSFGLAFNLSFTDAGGAPVGAGNMIPFQISGGQTRKFVSAGNAAVTSSGFARVEANGTVNGTAVFSQFNGPTLIGEAGVPAANAVPRQSIFVDEQGGFATGVAYANPGAAGANITLQLLNTEGTAVVASTTRNLSSNNHTAAFVRDLFSSAGAMTGTMQITSNTPLAAIALRFSPSGPFTTLPPVTLASIINPAVHWLMQKQWLAPVTSVARLLASFRIG